MRKSGSDGASRLAVVALVGDDDFGKRRALAALKNEVGGSGGDGDVLLLDAEGGDVAALGRRVVEELRTRPLGGGEKLVIVLEADELVRAHGAALLGFLEAPTDFSRLVLVARGLGPGRSKLRDALKRAGGYREFARPADRVAPWDRNRRADDTDLNRWLEARARTKRLRLEPGVAAALTARIGANLGELEAILDRWEMMAGPGAVIGAAAVEAVGPGHRETDSFALADAVMARDADRALEALAALFREGLGIGDRRLLSARDMVAPILGLFLRRLRQASRARRLLAAGARPGELAERLGVKPFLVSRTVEDARRFRQEELDRGIRRLLEADRRFKLEGQDAEKVLTDLVLELLQGGGYSHPVRV
ncbi:MAG: DNA polymerase III subunit delta [Planctomycetes bacterium]|nr:DNA polymerase III subunit delta [Planctomycetota bacterium]